MLKASVIGNLGSDPELQYSPQGQARLRMNVASNYRSKNAAGDWEDRTEWVRATVFGARAESLSQHLKKGAKVFVDGRLEARPWTAQDGSIRAGLELVAESIEFVSSRQDDGGEQRQPVATASAPRQQPQDLDDVPF